MAEKKNLIEIILMPIVIAFVGIAGTYTITNQQANITDKMAESDRKVAEAKAESDRKVAEAMADSDRKVAEAMADSDRQVKIMEIFAEKITSKEEKERVLAIKLLRALDDSLAEKLASAVAEAEPEKSEVRQVATKVADVAKARITLRPRIYIHVNGDSEKEAAKSVEQLLEKNGWIVPGIERVGAKSPKLSRFSYFKKAEKSTAEEIHNILKMANYDIQLKYVQGYEESKSIRPMHFEIWFAAGRPKVSS